MRIFFQKDEGLNRHMCSYSIAHNMKTTHPCFLSQPPKLSITTQTPSIAYNLDQLEAKKKKPHEGPSETSPYPLHDTVNLQINPPCKSSPPCALHCSYSSCPASKQSCYHLTTLDHVHDFTLESSNTCIHALISATDDILSRTPRRF